jgi:signal transduction histidine kinase
MLPDVSQRTRFEALRRRIFEEIGQSAARWRLTWLLPFHVSVVALLVLRGESNARATIQAATVTAFGVVYAARVFWPARMSKGVSFTVGVIAYFALLATTGGLASPLLVTGATIFTAAAITLRDPPWFRSAVFGAFFIGFAVLAIMSLSSVGKLDAPLTPHGSWPSPEYVAISLIAAACTIVGVNSVGCIITRGYERAALELAERREELCSENEDRIRSLEGVAARLAHEVKNPLAAIKGLSAHMARNASDAKTAERLAIVAAEADRLQSIVDGFLSFSHGLEDLKIAPTNLREVARELSVLLETRAADAGVTIEVGGEDDLVVDADVRKIRQGVLNLVLNAIQASPSGSNVSIAVMRDGDGARLTVRDDGVGMTPEVLDRIRKPYFTTREEGTGLGVAVARGVIEQHGGQLDFKSTPGKGTTATVRLPLKASLRAALPNLRGASKGCGNREPAPPRSLNS